jgi:hypothetical protein
MTSNFSASCIMARVDSPRFEGDISIPVAPYVMSDVEPPVTPACRAVATSDDRPTIARYEAMS